MSSLKINLKDMKFSKEATIKDLTNEEIGDLIHELVNILLERENVTVSHVTIANPYDNITVRPLTVGSPYTYTCTAKDLSTAVKNETEELL